MLAGAAVVGGLIGAISKGYTDSMPSVRVSEVAEVDIETALDTAKEAVAS